MSKHARVRPTLAMRDAASACLLRARRCAGLERLFEGLDGDGMSKAFGRVNQANTFSFGRPLSVCIYTSSCICIHTHIHTYNKIIRSDPKSKIRLIHPTIVTWIVPRPRKTTSLPSLPALTDVHINCRYRMNSCCLNSRLVNPDNPSWPNKSNFRPDSVRPEGEAADGVGGSSTLR